MSLGSEIAIGVVSGLTNGMLLFMVSVGLTITFGVLGVINFAHGSFYMLGAFSTFFLVGYLSELTGGFWIAVVISCVLVAALGGIIERLLIRPIYEHEHIFQLLLTFGIVLVLDNGARILWGTAFRSVETPSILSFSVSIFNRSYPGYNLFLIFAGAAVAAALAFLFSRTLIGKKVRAAAQDRETADAIGINVPAVFTGVFILGCALAGLGGALAAPYATIQPSIGENIIIDAFIVVLIAGPGSFVGAFISALLLGFADSFTFLYFQELRPFIPYLLLVTIILWRPTGLFGGETL